MSIADRKMRDKSVRRQAILNAAQQLFLQHGFEKVSMRNIADAIEYSPGTIYLYFKDKSELLFELQNQAFGQLVKSMEPVASFSHPAERLKALGETYLTFAVTHPELYELMFILTGPMDAIASSSTTPQWANGRAAFQRVVEVMQQGIATGVFQHPDAEQAALVVWGLVHGLAALLLRKRLVIFPEERRQTIVDEALNLFHTIVLKGL